jgi:hypothetical protein
MLVLLTSARRAFFFLPARRRRGSSPAAGDADPDHRDGRGLLHAGASPAMAGEAAARETLARVGII